MCIWYWGSGQSDIEYGFNTAIFNFRCQCKYCDFTVHLCVDFTVSSLKAVSFSNNEKFIVKLVITMMLLSITVQIVMFLIPGEGRMQGLVELAVAATIGVIVVIFSIVRMHLLSFRELKHLPFGDKLFHMKRGKH